MSWGRRALRGGRAYIQFRGFPPKMRDDLKKALGDKLTVQEGDWNCVLNVTPNNKVKPFNDARVRRALSMAINREAIQKVVMRNQSQPAGMIAPPFVNGWTADMDGASRTDVEAVGCR